MKEYIKPRFEEEKVILEDVLSTSSGSLNNSIDNDGRKWSGITYF